MDATWYILGIFVVFVGFVSKRYWSPSNSHSPANIYPIPGDLLSELRDKWKKPVESLPVSVDIPRLARKISIYKATENNNDTHKEPILLGRDDIATTNNDTTSERHEHVVIKDLITTLAQQLGEPTAHQQSIDERFSEFLKRSADPSQALGEFLEKVVGHHSPTTRVLKACNQSVLAPGVLVCILSPNLSLLILAKASLRVF